VAGRTGEVEEVRALGLVELQRAGQRLEHELGDAADLAALQAPVVVGADAGQRRDLLAAQARHPPLAEARQPGLLGRDVRPAGDEELGDVGRGVHDRHWTVDPSRRRCGALSVPL